jgi:hypothetical protein
MRTAVTTFGTVGLHGDTAARVTANVIRSRVARASHGKPVAEPLERTALRLLKRAGRPEPSERHARIRKHIAATLDKSSGAGTSRPHH